jgi:hypothetical protein
LLVAGIRRKSVKNYPRISSRVHPDCFAQLNRIAGDHSLGYAIEQLCQREKLVLEILESNLPAEQRLSAARVLIDSSLQEENVV